MRCLVLLLGLGVAVAGCGGGSSVYTAPKTRACLTKNEIKTSRAADFVASTATGGSFKAYFPNNDVTVVFGNTESDGSNLDQAYRRFHAENVGIDDVLFQDRNAVMLWHFHPSDADRSSLSGCLSS